MNADDARQYLSRRISPNEPFEALLEFPRFFEIETVNACNARCPMCTIGDWQRAAPTMKEPLFRKIADELTQHADVIRRVSLYRDGEPLLDKRLPDRVAALKQGGIREVSISSNVSLLDEKRGRALLEGGIDLVILSIDSLRKETFEEIRARLVFEEVMENAFNFIALRDALRPECRIWLRMIRQEANRDEWPAYQAFWSPKLGPSDRIYYHNIFNWGGQLDGYQPIAPSVEMNHPCVALWSLMVIFANGDVPLCNVDYNNKRPTGSVADASIEAVWRSQTAQARRALHLGGRKAELGLCADCNVWDEPEADVALGTAPEEPRRLAVGA